MSMIDVVQDASHDWSGADARCPGRAGTQYSTVHSIYKQHCLVVAFDGGHNICGQFPGVDACFHLVRHHITRSKDGQ